MTARANDVEPYAYLNYLFEYLPAASTIDGADEAVAYSPYRFLGIFEERVSG